MLPVAGLRATNGSPASIAMNRLLAIANGDAQVMFPFYSDLSTNQSLREDFPARLVCVILTCVGPPPVVRCVGAQPFRRTQPISETLDGERVSEMLDDRRGGDVDLDRTDRFEPSGVARSLRAKTVVAICKFFLAAQHHFTCKSWLARDRDAGTTCAARCGNPRLPCG